MLPRKTIVKLLSTHMLALTVLLALGFVLPAQAAILTDGEITITEVGGDDVPEGQYEVSNGSDLGIFAFGVSNNNTLTVSANFDWNARLINKTVWENVDELILNQSLNDVPFTDFGDFEDFFASADSVNFYIFNGEGIIDPGAFVSDAFFFQPGTINSTAVAFLTDGSSVALTAVPVPAAFLLFGSGLVGLLGLKRRLGS